MNAGFDATMDVEVLAAAFNMSKAEFMGQRVLVDSFGELDNERLEALFGGEDWYTEITADEKAALDAIPAVMVDERWMMIFDRLFEFTEQYNGENMGWQYWLHKWMCFGISPFANAAVFVPGAPAVNSITITPSAISLAPGTSANLKVEVDTDNFASKAVVWTSSSDDVTVDIYGTVTVKDDATAGSVTITATSVVDSSVTATCTVTVTGE